MGREISISLYLFFFKWVFLLFNFFPLKNKTTFVISFGDNSLYVLEEMHRQDIQDDVVFLCKGNSKLVLNDFDYVNQIQFETYNVWAWLTSIYHLATSKHILADNYFAFLAVTKFRPGVEFIQLWHASGAIKKFGLEDESTNDRSEKAKQRFLQVYDRFNKVVVGSDCMADIFMDAFNLPSERILKTGVPRTDLFYDEAAKKKIIHTLKTENNLLKEKKVILYAPTYRDYEIDHFNLKLDIAKMERELGRNHVLILRLHPAIKHSDDFSKEFPEFVFDYSSSKYQIIDLLLVADYLITDYSSVIYEYSLLRKPVIFFTYDVEEYQEGRGIWDGFLESLPGPVVSDTDSIIEVIKKNQFELSLIDKYAKTWNKYSNGHSSENLVRYMFADEIQKRLN